MHDVSREASRWFKNTRKTVKDAGLLDPSLKLLLLVDSIALRFQNMIKISSIFFRINQGKVADVNIRVIAGWVICAEGFK